MTTLLDLLLPAGPQLAVACSIAAMLLALGVVGWEPALSLTRHRLTRPSRTAHPPTSAADPFVWVPPVVEAGQLLGVLGLTVLILLGASLWWGQPLLLILLPLAVAGTHMLTVTVARQRYIARLEADLLGAMQSLSTLMAGGRMPFPQAVATLVPSLTGPLHTEWQWMLTHVNMPYLVTRADGGAERRTSTLADLCERLATQTPSRVHGRVLDQLVTLLSQRLPEAQQAERIAQLTATLAQRATLARTIVTMLGRIRAEALVISGALSLTMGYLAWAHTERFVTAFGATPWGWAVALWLLLWILLPLVVAALIARAPELPL